MNNNNINHFYKNGEWYYFICDYCNGISSIIRNENKSKADIIRELNEFMNKDRFYIPMVDLRDNKNDNINYYYNNIYDFLKDYSNIIINILNNEDYKTQKDIENAYYRNKMGKFDIE
jgi:Ribonuclease G/E